MGGRSSGSKFSRREEDIKRGPLIFGKAAIVNNSEGGYIDIDGYLYARNENDLLLKLAKAVDLYNKGEADGLRDLVKFNETSQIHADKNAGPNQFILEWEDVPGASRWNEEKDEMEYSDKRANYYVHMRMVK